AAHHPTGIGAGGEHPDLDARPAQARVRLGAHHFRRAGARPAVAPEPEGDGIEHPDAGGRTAPEAGAGSLQERARAAATRDDEALQGSQRQPVRRLPPDALADAGAVRAAPPAGAGEDVTGNGKRETGSGKGARLVLSDPIVALATPPGRSALALIRLSGKGAFEVAARVLHPFRPDPPCAVRRVRVVH